MMFQHQKCLQLDLKSRLLLHTYFPATVLGNVSADSKIISEEVFGPVAAVVKVKDEEEALKISNKSEYGLAGYIYTKDLARGWKVSEALQVGMIGLNRGLVSDPSAPFGGVKQSGLGREGGYDDKWTKSFMGQF